MGIVEGLIYTLWRGIAIGFIISAPMGPVGILCVQRTLDKGRKTGFYTGIGAVLSDILYCLLTGFGLSFIEEFLERNSNVIQLIGSVVLIGFGVYLFRSNPSRQLKKPGEKGAPAGRNILNGFLFTFSNPLIIFLIIGLFARFNFMLPELKFYAYIVGFLGIFAGALGWWYIVTFFVDKVRAHFNLRSMWLINKIIGTLIFIFAVVGIITAVSGLASAAERKVYMNPLRGYSLFHNVSEDGVVVKAEGPRSEADLISASGITEMKFRVRNLHNERGKTYRYRSDSGGEGKSRFPGWGIVLKGKEGEAVVWIRTVDDNADETYSTPGIMVVTEAGGKESRMATHHSGFDLYGGLNAFRVNISGEDWIVSGGNRRYEKIAGGKLESGIDSIGFIVSPGGKIAVDDIVISDSANLFAYSDSDALPEQEEELRRIRMAPEDELEGEWGVYDYQLDDKFLRAGGDYRLAIVREGDVYELLYVAGARTNGGRWQKGMRKGALRPGMFDGVYEMEWISAEGVIIKGIKVQKEGEMLVMHFPNENSEMRLRKI